MGRALVDRAERPSSRRGIDAALIVAAGVVLLFAVVGVVSAGSFVAGKVSGSSTKPTATVKTVTTSPLVAQSIRRAHAQATAIVKQAQSAGHSIVASASAKAHRQANAVIASARRQAASYRPPTVAAPAPAPAPTAVPNVSAPSAGATAGGVASGVVQSPNGSSSSLGATGNAGTPSGTGVATGSGLSTGSTGSTGTGASNPDLRNLPASWLVVGYNATFSGGSGQVGTISVVNRSGKTFSGVAVVKYKTGGSASAGFSGLAPGQTLVLPLSGAPYEGGGYSISMTGLH